MRAIRSRAPNAISEARLQTARELPMVKQQRRCGSRKGPANCYFNNLLMGETAIEQKPRRNGPRRETPGTFTQR